MQSISPFYERKDYSGGLEMSLISRTLKFPPITFLIALIIGFGALQGYLQYAGAGETPEIQHLEPSISTDSDTYNLGSTVKIMVTVAEGHGHGEEGHEDEHQDEAHEEGEEGHEDEHQDDDQDIVNLDEGMLKGLVQIIMYSPNGTIYEIIETEIGEDVMAIFEITIGKEASVGKYIIIAEAIFEDLPTVISESIDIEVVDSN
jgi:hypothetical protein